MHRLCSSSVKRQASQAGFTLIELLVVIAIIGVTSSTVLASLDTSREAARDVRREQDLRQIERALILWEQRKGQPMRGDSGCGFKQPSGGYSWTGNEIGDGNGWFNVGNTENSYYDKSISDCLADEGFMSGSVADPDSTTVSDASSGNAYMKCTRDGETWLYAHLEDADGNCSEKSTTCDDYCTKYNMNYAKQVNY